MSSENRLSVNKENKLPKNNQDAVALLKKHDTFVATNEGQPKYFAMTTQQARAIAEMIEVNDIGKDDTTPAE